MDSVDLSLVCRRAYGLDSGREGTTSSCYNDATAAAPASRTNGRNPGVLVARYPAPRPNEGIRLMPSEIIDWNAPSLQGGFPKLPGDLPHGLIVPPQEVRDDLEASNAKLLREHGFTLNEEAWVRELNRHTLDYY